MHVILHMNPFVACLVNLHHHQVVEHQVRLFQALFVEAVSPCNNHYSSRTQVFSRLTIDWTEYQPLSCYILHVYTVQTWTWLIRQCNLSKYGVISLQKFVEKFQFGDFSLSRCSLIYRRKKWKSFSLECSAESSWFFIIFVKCEYGML